MGALEFSARQAVVHTDNALTVRELEILDLSGKGLSMKGVAMELGISAGTVRWHLRNSFRKLGVNSRESALKKARAGNLIESLYVCQVCACAMTQRFRVPSVLVEMH